MVVDQKNKKNYYWAYLRKLLKLSEKLIIMLLGFKTELYPNNSQKTLLAKHAGVARHAWNWGLWLTRNIRPL